MGKEQMTKEEFVEFNTEMARLKSIKWMGYERTLKAVGVTYLGAVSVSAKLAHSEKYSHVNTYGIYLASADLSGFNVCSHSTYCKDNCLMGSGRNKVERLSNRSSIDTSRIIKTRLFFANREVFMKLMIHEIKREMKRAKLIGNFFAIRLNCTSDLSPLLFTLNGKNVLDIFNKCVIYDYTKVPSRLNLLNRYPNYDLTWSIDGSNENLEIGLGYLESGGRVAVVYGEDIMPKKWYGYDTCDGDLTDYRIQDPAQVCMLKFKRTADNYKGGKFILPNTDFIVTKENENVEW